MGLNRLISQHYTVVPCSTTVVSVIVQSFISVSYLVFEIRLSILKNNNDNEKKKTDLFDNQLYRLKLFRGIHAYFDHRVILVGSESKM